MKLALLQWVFQSWKTIGKQQLVQPFLCEQGKNKLEKQLGLVGKLSCLMNKSRQRTTVLARVTATRYNRWTYKIYCLTPISKNKLRLANFLLASTPESLVIHAINLSHAYCWREWWLPHWPKFFFGFLPHIFGTTWKSALSWKTQKTTWKIINLLGLFSNTKFKSKSKPILAHTCILDTKYLYLDTSYFFINPWNFKTILVNIGPHVCIHWYVG